MSWTLIGKFLTSKLGIALMLVLATVIACVATYKAIAGPAYERGALYERSKCIGEAAVAAQAQQRRERAQRDAASRIAAEAFKAGQASVQATAIDTNKTKEVIRYVYRDRIKTAPITAGSCVHALDGSVQDRLDAAVRAANGSP
jgi:hypothetical protein